MAMTAQSELPSAGAAGADTFFKLAMAIGVVVVGLEVGYLLLSPLPYDPLGYYVGRDFVNTWLGGQLALTGDPAPFFGPDAYNALLAEKFGPGYPFHIWSYPPHFLLFTWVWGLMPYMLAYVLYSLFGLILYLAVVTDGRPRADHLMLLVLAPAVRATLTRARPRWTGCSGRCVGAARGSLGASRPPWPRCAPKCPCAPGASGPGSRPGPCKATSCCIVGSPPRAATVRRSSRSTWRPAGRNCRPWWICTTSA